MFRAVFCPSSGAYDCDLQLLVLCPIKMDIQQVCSTYMVHHTYVLTPYDQYFSQSLHQEGKLIPEQHPGKKNLLLQLAINPSYTPLEETSQATSFIPYTQCHVAALRTQPTAALGMYFLIYLIYIIDPTCASVHSQTQKNPPTHNFKLTLLELPHTLVHDNNTYTTLN